MLQNNVSSYDTEINEFGISINSLLEAKAQYGHQSCHWSPKMLPYIYAKTPNHRHIINLNKTVILLARALKEIKKVAANKGRILFVGTKMQASNAIKEAALRCGQHYVNQRWLSGMLTNWNAVSSSIKKLIECERVLEKQKNVLTKKELLGWERKRQKLENSIGGVRYMGGLPNIIFVVDTNKEKIVINEAVKLGIPVVAIVDTNSDPDKINYVIPGNDDSSLSIEYFCNSIADAVLGGIASDLEGKPEIILKKEEVHGN